MKEKKIKALKLRLNGAEGSPCIEKSPCTKEDVVAALAFLTETAEMVITIGEFVQNESGDWIEC